MKEETAVATASEVSGSVGLEVPGEPGVWWCARHRKTQTRLRCGRCETPICPKCTVYGPTGARCRSCASNRGSHMYQVGAVHLLITFAASAALGLVGAAAIQFTGLFLLVFFAPALGGLLGKAVPTITRGKRGPLIAGAASAGIICGAVALLTMRWMSLPQIAGFGAPSLLPYLLTSGLPVLLFAVLAIVGMWWWLK